MMDTNSFKENNRNGYINVICVLIFLIIFISFSVALSQFIEPKQNQTDISDTESFVSTETSDETEVSVPTRPAKDYQYYDKINYTETPISNTKAVYGALSLSSEALNIPDEELVPIHSSRTGKYDLKDYSLRLRKEAITNIDLFIMSFYSKYKNNGLGIAEGYKLTSEGVYKDLCSGYSVKFTTYKTSNVLSDEDFSYLKEQSFKYGIVQRYPEGKKESTGFDENLEIYRYVGLVHSCYMSHYNLSMEEYVDKIKTEKVIEYKNNYESDATYLIYYIPVDDSKDSTYIKVPSDPKYTYSVSGDGENGFIITVKI